MTSSLPITLLDPIAELGELLDCGAGIASHVSERDEIADDRVPVAATRGSALAHLRHSPGEAGSSRRRWGREPGFLRR